MRQLEWGLVGWLADWARGSAGGCLVWCDVALIPQLVWHSYYVGAFVLVGGLSYFCGRRWSDEVANWERSWCSMHNWLYAGGKFEWVGSHDMIGALRQFIDLLITSRLLESFMDNSFSSTKKERCIFYKSHPQRFVVNCRKIPSYTFAFRWITEILFITVRILHLLLRF